MALEVKKKYPVPLSSKAHHKLPQRTLKREQRRASMRRTLNVCLTLAVLATGSGIAYTWYAGQHYAVAADQAEPAVSKRVTITPSKVASDAPIGAAVQTFTPEIKPGENASVSIRTNPEAECTIEVSYNDVKAVDSGLVPKVSDEYGVVSWAWTVPAGTPAGKWPAGMTCKNKKNTAFVKADIVIK